MPDTHTPVETEQLDAFRQAHIGRLFLRAHRDFSERAVEKLRERGHSGLTLVHTGLLAHLDTTGTRSTTLAERAGITKQAIGHLVADLEDKGYIQREVDPTDRRAALITFTADGWRFLQDAYHIKQEIEADYVAILGDEGMDSLRGLLTKLLEETDAPDSASM